MTTELFYLTLTALLAASLWIPYIVGTNMVVSDPGPDFIRPPDLRERPEWVHRAHRAHLNLLEQFVPFAALILIAHTLNIQSAIIAWCAAIFFWLRVAHAVGMISGLTQFPVRPIIFSAGYIAILVIGFVVMTSG
ncbi:MAG: MAPEG family protein [Pseudomonadota bacterium]